MLTDKWMHEDQDRTDRLVIAVISGVHRWIFIYPDTPEGDGICWNEMVRFFNDDPEFSFGNYKAVTQKILEYRADRLAREASEQS